MPKHSIVLAHGFLGFGGNFKLLSYFNGVKEHLENQGHHVYVPEVSPTRGVDSRGQELLEQIEVVLKHDRPVHIIAHSMGGLDARYALTRTQAFNFRIKTLVTIGTPHLGSPVADAVFKQVEPPLKHIPQILQTILRDLGEGLKDLTTESCRHRNSITPDVPGVRYVEVAGDAQRGDRELLLFKLAAEIGQLTNEINDGVVTKRSALRDGTEHLEDWPVDHAGEIGWALNAFPPLSLTSIAETRAHLARYDALVKLFDE